MKSRENQTPQLPNPLHLLIALLVIICVIESLVHFYLQLIVPDTHQHLQGIVDALLLTGITAPFIRKLIAKPLRTAAITELARTNTVLNTLEEAVIRFNA